MRFKFTIFLIVLNVIAFGLILFLGKRPDSVSVAGGLSTIIGRGVVEADRIELRGQNLDEPRILKREGSSWSIAAPMQWSANYFAVNRILNQLQFLEEEASFSLSEIEQTGQTLADYGLENPLITLTVAREEDSVSLSVGTLTEIGNNVYLLSPDEEEIYVVNREVIDSLLVDLADLRTREIFDIPVFEVEALSLQIKAEDSIGNGDLKVRLARTNDGWIFEAPLTAVADPTLVSNAINTLSAAKVVRFAEISDPGQGLENPSMRVTLHGNKRRQTLFIGSLDPGATEANPAYFAKLENNPTLFTVGAKPFDALKEAQEALRERNFMNFDQEQLTSINLSESGQQLRLQKLETGGWQVIESSAGADIQPYRVDAEIIRQLVTDLRTFRASGFAVDTPDAADLDRLGFSKPRRSVTLSFSEGDDLVLQLAHPDTENKKLYAKTNRADYVYQVERRETLRKLPLSKLFYRNRILETLPEAAQITALKLENIVTGEVFFDHKLGSEDTLWLNALEEVELEQKAAILGLLTSVRQLEVRRYLKDSYRASYRVDKEKSLPWTFRLSAQILLPGGDTKKEDGRVYVFTERLSGTVQVGGSELHKSTFEAVQATVDNLYLFTDTMKLPPEATGGPVPDPRLVELLPEPTPIKSTDVVVEPLTSSDKGNVGLVE